MSEVAQVEKISNKNERLREPVLAEFTEYIKACEKETRSKIMHRTIVKELAIALGYRDMKTIFIIFGSIVAVLLPSSLIFLILAKSRVMIAAFAILFACLCTVLISPLITDVVQCILDKKRFNAIKLLIPIIVFFLAGLLVMRVRESSTTWGIVAYCLTALALALIAYFSVWNEVVSRYTTHIASITGRPLAPKFYEDICEELGDAIKSGRINTAEDLKVILSKLELPEKEKEELIAYVGNYSQSEFDRYMEVPTIFLKALQGNLSGAELVDLIKKTEGMFINREDIHERTYLEYAIEFAENPDYCLQLLKAGADPVLLNHDGGTLLHSAIKKGLLTMPLFQEFMKTNSTFYDGYVTNVLWYFVRYEQPELTEDEEKEIVRIFVEKGISIEDSDVETEQTTLDVAKKYKPYLYGILKSENEGFVDNKF